MIYDISTLCLLLVLYAVEASSLTITSHIVTVMDIEPAVIEDKNNQTSSFVHTRKRHEIISLPYQYITIT